MRIRRSSTSRSIGARSDFSLNGVDADDEDGDAQSTTASVFPDDPDRARQRSEADSHMHQYISDQLERYRIDQTSNEYEQDLETDAKLG